MNLPEIILGEKEGPEHEAVRIDGPSLITIYQNDNLIVEGYANGDFTFSYKKDSGIRIQTFSIPSFLI